MLQLMIFVIIFTCTITWLASTAQISPFSSILTSPQRIYRQAYTISSLQGSSATFNITYQYYQWTTAPIVLYSVSSITFNNGLNYNFRLKSVQLTSLQAQINFTQTISQVSFLFMIMDSQLYKVTMTEYVYNMPVSAQGQQQFLITGIQNHHISFATAMEIEIGNNPSGYVPSVQSFVISTGNLVTTNISVTYDTTKIFFKMIKVVMVDFDIGSFKGVQFYKGGQKWVLFGTSGISTDPYSTSSYLSHYKNNYFTGLVVIYDGQFSSSPLSLDISTGISSKVYYFTTQIIIASYYCPSSFPITDINRQYCYSGCNDGEYYDEQFMCKLCNSNCKTCYRKDINCTSCYQPYTLGYGFVCGCPFDQYPVTMNNGSIYCTLCSQVIQGCQRCASEVECTRCMSNMQLIDATTCQCPSSTITLSKQVSRQLQYLNQTVIVVETQYFCIQNETSSYLSENCRQDYYQQELTCQCHEYFNLTLKNGSCSNKTQSNQTCGSQCA